MKSETKTTEINKSSDLKRVSKYSSLKKDLKFEIFSYINLSDILNNLIYVDKKTNISIKDYIPFKILLHISNENSSEIDFSATKEENINYLKNVCSEINLNPYNINFTEIALFIKILENKENENLNFNGN